ncbi:MG2 domain-containing protein [uncultured Cohaesibacter sp.]|uniref:MG2 domain-containing protein n=1 Tax=uncultured Cohaesibacter sp. TaxID=1002546 RepID=UPI00292F19AC|nr:MG2 domain-containing protein [uncultured Cohaesibacter sp.]
MARLLSALATLALVSMSLVSSSWALDVSFSKKLLLSKDTDFYGFDYKMLKKVSFENCQSACLKDNQCKAFTYNEKARFCFLKSDFAQATPFKGAISGRVMDVHASEPDLGKADKLDIDAYLYRTADALGKGLNKGTDPNASLGYEELKGRGLSALDFNDLNTSINFLRSALRIHPDDSEAWRSYSEASLKLAKTTEDSKTARGARLIAISAAINAHSTSRYRTERAAALSQLAQSLELSSRYREAIDSFKLALDLRENPADREDYRRLLESHGFRMVNHSIDADLQSPRICLQFSEKLKKGYGDFASFIRVDQAPPKALDISDQQICMEGLAHGQTYQIDVREGLPAENGEALLTNQQLELFIRDRAPGMRFTGNNYVLPANNRRGIPLVSVNADEAKLALYRVGDRSLANLIRSTDFLSQMESWQVEELVSDLGAPFWKGAMTIASEKNREVVTSIPIDEALPERKPGVYLLTASAKTIDLNDYPSLASQWFVISDIGLTTFSSTSAPPSRSDEADLGGLQVFARSLETALPLSGIKVELISRNNEILGTGISDETGMISFDAGLLRGKDGLAPSVLTASNGADDFVFLDLTRAGFDLSDRGVTGRASPEGIDLYAWTERGVYRPGEVVHLSALARDDGAKAVEDLPLTFIFERPDGVEVQRLVGSGKAMGGYAVDLPLLSSAQRGSWRANIFADTEKPALASLTFLVEDFIPDRTDMTLTPDSDIIALGDVASGKIEGRYLYGAPAAGLEISADVLVRETRSRKGYEGYLFGLDEVESNGVERVDVDALPPLDENGVGRFEFTLGELMASTRPKTADLIIRMQEGSGRAISRSVNYRIEPSDVMLGIKPLFDGTQVSENSNADFQLIAVNPDESRATESNVEWSLVKIDRHYQWYRDGNNWYFEAVDLESKVADGHVDLGKDDPAKLSLPVEWGRYRLALGETTSFEFRAGWVSAGGSVDTPDGLELALDKASYKVGDVAELKISPRFAGKLLLAIGTDRIHQTMEVDVPENGATLDIPVKEDWGAGAYLLANLYRPSDKGASRNPMRAIGVQWLGIEPEDRALTITMTKPATIRPHEQMVVPVKVEGVKPGEEAYVNVALVDEGILTLTHYKSPDPVGRYFGQRRLGVDIRDLYGRLIDGSSGAFGRLRTGGDGAGPQMDSSGEVPTQELVAFVSGIVKLNENGEAEVAFDIPQFNGTGRLMATAWTKKAVGGNDLEAIIRDPIVVHVGLPKVLAPGDASRALVELTNLEAPAGDYRIDILTNDAIELDLSQTPKVISLENDKMVTLSVPLHAKAKGVGDVTVKLLSASDNGVGVLYDAQVPVRSGMLPVTHVARIPLEPKGGKFVLDGSWFSGLQKSGATVSLSVGETGTFDVTSLLMQLDRYPYGCAEQVTSRALPLLYAGDLALHMPKELASLSGKEMTERIQKAIDTLLSYQSDLGGFSLWGGSSHG